MKEVRFYWKDAEGNIGRGSPFGIQEAKTWMALVREALPHYEYWLADAELPLELGKLCRIPLEDPDMTEINAVFRRQQNHTFLVLSPSKNTCLVDGCLVDNPDVIESFNPRWSPVNNAFITQRYRVRLQYLASSCIVHEATPIDD